MFQIFVRYLQNQNRVLPTVVFGGIGNAMNALAQYLAVVVLKKGIIGSAVGQDICYLLMVAMTVGYIIWTGLYKETWSGWSWRALDNWGQFLHLAIGGLIMTVVEWWCIEIGIFLNGLLGEVELGATTVLFQTENALYVIPYGIAVACSIRIGHSLGAGNAATAMTTARTAQVFAGLGFLVVGTVLFSVRHVLPRIFTQDPEVIELSSGLIRVMVLFAFLDCIMATSMGTLRGSGRQWTGAVCNVLGYLVLAVPLACVFMFVLHMGAYGFWYGLVIGITPTAIIYLVIVMLRINWEDEALKAQSRTSETVEIPSEKRPLLSSETVEITSEKTPLLSSKTVEITSEKTSLLSSESDIGDNNSNLSYRRTDSGETEKKNLRLRNTGNQVYTKMPTSLLVKRLLNCFAVLCILLGGLFVRLFVPLPVEDFFPVSVNTTVIPVLSSTSNNS